MIPIRLNSMSMMVHSHMMEKNIMLKDMLKRMKTEP